MLQTAKYYGFYLWIDEESSEFMKELGVAMGPAGCCVEFEEGEKSGSCCRTPR
jgi:hypothetical protein